MLLDLGLPDLGGHEVLARLRETSSVPVILVTARAEEPGRVVLSGQQAGRHRHEGHEGARPDGRADALGGRHHTTSWLIAWMTRPARAPTTVPLMRMNWRSRPT